MQHPVKIIDVPEMTIEKYADRVGVCRRVVEGWIEKGYLPTVKIGKRRLVNVVQRTVDIQRKEASK